ncbi:hypothetical protein B6658_000290 [Campylobacter coli]|nr:hypothetical protein [Campylobacter coli]EJF0700298.1 hypothetical protein [Campylobacter coli]ELE7049260.1 hypothetical protein [Campylobacter coli]ELK0855937.1 hypothetical protein [Campylobacter coli]
MEKYFIGFETENDGFLITLKNTENLKLDHIKQSCYSFFHQKILMILKKQF